MSNLIKSFVKIVFTVALMCMISSAFVSTHYNLFSVTTAHAQVKKPKKRKNIFKLLFGKRGSLNSRKSRSRAERVRIKRNKLRRVKRNTKPRIAAVNKKEDAMKILVAGDFMAGSLAKGLIEAYAENPEVVIVNISNGLSGFVRDDVKNWPEKIAPHIEEYKPTAVVFLSGMNDRQQMRLKTGRFAKMSEQWLTTYNARTKALATNVQSKKIPFIWLGLPPVKSNKMSTDYLVFNQIYKSQAEEVGGTYVDVWDGFTNEGGQYVSAGPDINGQIKRLRASDGINMNRTGRRKLAFYARKAIKKLTNIGSGTVLASLPGIEDPRPVTPQYNPAKTGKTIVYSLANPNLDGANVLAGGDLKEANKRAEKSVSFGLVNTGILPKTHAGRIDHYGVVANEAEKTLAGSKDSNKKEAKAKELLPPITQ